VPGSRRDLAGRKGGPAAGFLQRTVQALRRFGVRVAVVMTDNGSCYRSWRFGYRCRRLGLRHLFTRPYTTRTNGKVERFIKTVFREWAYARLYYHSAERRAALAQWLRHYNWHHGSLPGRPPITQVLSADNLMRVHNVRKVHRRDARTARPTASPAAGL
jgi:transposase InsO family protein